MAALCLNMKSATVILEVEADDLRKRTYTIPSSLVSYVEGLVFVQLSQRHHATRRLCALRATHDTQSEHGNETWRVFGASDVMDQLRDARDDAVKRFVSDGRPELLKGRWWTWRRWQTKYAELPQAIDVTTPVIGDLEPIVMKMLTDRSAVVSAQLNSATLTWITSAIASQFKSGEIASQKVISRRSKKRHASSDTDACDDSADDSVGEGGDSDEAVDHNEGCDGEEEAIDACDGGVENNDDDVGDDELDHHVPQSTATGDAPAPADRGTLFPFFRRR